MSPQESKTTILTPEEDARWQQLFALGMNQGMTESQADYDAWIGLQEEFPRLRKYDGCE